MTGRIAPQASRQPTQPPAGGGKSDNPNFWEPPVMRSVEDTGLNMLSIADLVLKTLYFGGFMTGQQVADYIKLPFTGVLDSVMEFLKREKFVEIKGAGGVGSAAYQYIISDKGSDKAREAMERSNYAGPCPVTLAQYNAAMRAQNKSRMAVTQDLLLNSLTHLVVSKNMLNKIGPAANSGKSIFLYGPPGNGKTTISEAVGRLVLGSDIWIPYAIDIDGQIVRVFDSVNHEVLEAPTSESGSRTTGLKRDPRWLRIRRPVIMVGGELTLAGLDLVYDDTNKYYEAPFQVKANNGMLLVDDFGRQKVSPSDLLNRWIVPLESEVDYLSMHTGKKLEVPFDSFVVFSTNLDPKDLVDAAFMRRVPYKLEVRRPDLRLFGRIFQRECKKYDVPWDKRLFIYLLKKHYEPKDRPLNACEPRDLLKQVVNLCAYRGQAPQMTEEILDRVVENYFVQFE
jgi:hypothetical protein